MVKHTVILICTICLNLLGDSYMRKSAIYLLLVLAIFLTSVSVPAYAAPSPSPSAQPGSKTTTQPASKETETSDPAPWFDNCALIGDSVSDGLKLYAMQKRKKDPGFLGNLQFLTRNSYSLTFASAANPDMLLKYRGASMRPEDALKEMKAEKVFIMLGLNDMFHDGSENTAKYNKLIDNIRAKNPNIKICLIAMTPIVTSGQYSEFQNTNVNEYNEVVRNVSSGKRCDFIDFNDKLRDETGGLKEEYSRDGFVHLKGGAYEIYAAALSKNAQFMDR